MKPIQVVIPMAGIGSRFKTYGFRKNKYLLPINRDLTPMIEMAIDSLGIHVPCKYYFIINEENGIDQDLRNMLAEISNRHSWNYHIASVDKLTDGPASTVNHIRDLILDKSCPMIISNSDQVLSWSFERFHEKCLDPSYAGCLLTYCPTYELVLGEKDKHSFVRLDQETGEIVQCAEKIVLSNKAIVGTHYFAASSDFFEAYDYMITHNLRAPNGEFYISLAYQAMIEQGKRISYYDLDSEKSEFFYPVGEPDDYFSYLYKCGGYKKEVMGNLDSTKLSSWYNKVISSEITIGPGDGAIAKLLDTSDQKDNTWKDISKIVNTDFDLTGLFSWYSKNISSLIELKRYVGEVSDGWKHLTNNDFFVLLEGEGMILDDLGSWIKLEQYDITSYKNVKIKSSTTYLEIYMMDAYDKKDAIWSRDSFTRGWFLGAFEPSVCHTEEFEVGILIHEKDEKWDYHYHKIGKETNILLQGRMKINEQIIEAGSIFVFPPGQIACPIFLETCHVLCIKEPSIPGDKYCL